MFGGGIVDSMVAIAMLYILPVFIFVVSYIVNIIFDLKEYINTGKIKLGTIIEATIKTVISVFFLYLTNKDLAIVLALIKDLRN